MSLPDRRFILLAPLAFAACGFTPVYAPDGPGAALQNKVLVDAPGTQDAYLLTRELEQKLGRSDTPVYALSLDLDISRAQVAIDREGDTGRFNRNGAVNFALREMATGQIATSGRVENFVGYSATGTTVETLAGEADAQRRLMVILADQIIARLHAADLTS